MAEEKKADAPPKTTDAPDPDEDDLDELDDVLDQFNATNISKDAPSQSHAPKADDKPKDTGDVKTTDSEDDVDFAKQLEIGMAEMLRELESNPEMAKQFEDMMRQLGPVPDDMPSPSPAPARDSTEAKASPSAAAAPSSSTSKEKDKAKSPPPKGDAGDAQEPNFQDTIRRTMERMRASNASADAASSTKGGNNPSEDDIMSALLQEITNSAGGPEGDDAFSNMLLGMMEQLTNKEILYEPMKELNDKFPAWLAERKEGGPKASELSDEDRKRYEEQSVHVKAIVDRFEKSSYKDSNPEDREFIVNSMQKMQAAGAPPPDLVGDMGAASQMLGDADKGCPQQ